MAKNSPKPEAERQPTDGAISVATTSSILLDDAPQEEGVERRELTFPLDAVPLAVLRHLTVGIAVNLETNRPKVAAFARGSLLGFVPSKFAGRARNALRNPQAEAWISDLPHEGIIITIEW